MVRFLLFCLLFVLCWPFALLALLAYPLVWLIALPFRILGRTVSSAIDLVLAIVLFPLRLPARLLRA
jgi:hypothetical protein